ncbi:MAG: nicotinate phosphoribosyltransferase [Thainema sp.]
MTPSLVVTPQDYSLLTDLYQLTMAACYVGEGLDQRRASFELFTRKLPNGFGYLIAMGLAQVMDYIDHLHFDAQQIQALQETGLFDQAPDEFWAKLADFQFGGDVWAMPEGTAVFPNEPLLRVEAPLWQAQLLETYVLNTINYQTLVGTRAARMRHVAGNDAKILEFGTRRAFSPQASVWAARAAIAGGLDSTSNVLAAIQLGRKPSGTMAHSLVMSLSALAGTESDAFNAFQRYFPTAPLLIDTYDTINAATELARRVREEGLQVTGVRLDSGDLVELSQKVRSLLPDITIFASGDLDEWEIARLKAAGASIDGYGIGTKLVTGDPVNGVYKIVEIDGIPVMKRSTDKVTYPSRKQVFRQLQNGKAIGDRLALIDESPNANEIPLLQLVYQNGQRIQAPDPLDAIAQRTAATVASLPEAIRRLDNPDPYPLQISDALETCTTQTRQHTEKLMS